MRLSQFAILGALAVGAVACREDSADFTTPTIPPLAYVRYINAIPDTLPVLVRWIDQVQFVPSTFVNVRFRQQGQGNYQGLDVRAKRIRVFTYDSSFSVAGNTVVLLDTSLTFEAGKYYTILHAGYTRTGALPRHGLRVIEDALPNAGTNVLTRYINSGVNLGSFDLYALPTATSAVTGTPIVSGLAAGAVSPWVSRAPAAFATTSTAPGSTTALFSTLAPAGVAGNPFVPSVNGIAAIPAVDPISGSTVPGSTMTAVIFPASSPNTKGSVFSTPGFAYFLDKQPPRFTTP